MIIFIALVMAAIVVVMGLTVVQLSEDAATDIDVEQGEIQRLTEQKNQSPGSNFKSEPTKSINVLKVSVLCEASRNLMIKILRM